jgi:hypothetical protein
MGGWATAPSGHQTIASAAWLWDFDEGDDFDSVAVQVPYERGVVARGILRARSGRAVARSARRGCGFMESMHGVDGRRAQAHVEPVVDTASP